MSHPTTPTVGLRSAPYIGWGSFLVLVPAGLLLGFDTLLGTYGGDPAAIAWGALLTLAAGAALLGTGLARYASHSDRANGVAAYAFTTGGDADANP